MAADSGWALIAWILAGIGVACALFFCWLVVEAVTSPLARYQRRTRRQRRAARREMREHLRLISSPERFGDQPR